MQLLLFRIIFFIVYELDTQSQDLNSDYTLKDCLFGGVKNADLEKYDCSGNGVGFDLHWEFWLPGSSIGPKKRILFPEIDQVKIFLRPTRQHKSNVLENICLLCFKITHTYTHIHTHTKVSLVNLFVWIYFSPLQRVKDRTLCFSKKNCC